MGISDLIGVAPRAWDEGSAPPLCRHAPELDHPGGGCVANHPFHTLRLCQVAHFAVRLLLLACNHGRCVDAHGAHFLGFRIKAIGWLMALLMSLSQAQYRGHFTERDFATRVFHWSGVNGAPGFNTDPTQVLGFPPPGSTPTAPDNSKVFSFGWGGFIEVGFVRPIQNLPSGVDPHNPDGYDLIVFGNAFYVGGDPCRVWGEPGYVEVGIDRNGNGVPDSEDDWYLLLPPHPDPRDAQGIPRFPLSSEWFGSLTICPTPIVGYADITPITNQGHPLVPDDPMVPGIQGLSAGGDAFKLEWAIDWQTGQPVPLAEAHFIRISHAGNASLAPFGRSSTEVSAIALVRRYGDTNADGCVDDADLLTVLLAFGQTGSDLPEDINRDEIVDDADLMGVLFGFGGGC
ncbi:hypothetical protein HRbin15_01174 [bacterium HR15]|nr:hypothetical protein HRbin15_01174 [bacterium HR15]